VIQSNANNLQAADSGQVPDQVKLAVAMPQGIGLGHPWIDTIAYAPVNIPANLPQRFGDSGKDTLRGPGFLNLDSGLFRDFHIKERVTLQFRAEALNLLNHPNFANPGADISTPSTFGYVTATASAGTTVPNAGRQFRFATRVVF